MLRRVYLHQSASSKMIIERLIQIIKMMQHMIQQLSNMFFRRVSHILTDLSHCLNILSMCPTLAKCLPDVCRCVPMFCKCCSYAAPPSPSLFSQFSGATEINAARMLMQYNIWRGFWFIPEQGVTNFLQVGILCPASYVPLPKCCAT